MLEEAAELIFAAISRGISVVTANRELVAASIDKLKQKLGATEGNVGFGFEATVCDGLPIINALLSAHVEDTVTEIFGVLDTTSTLVLPVMDKAGSSFAPTLAGAEKTLSTGIDFRSDVNGHNSRLAIALLTKLAFGITVHDMEGSIPCSGISGLTDEDFEFARKESRTIRLIGRAKLDCSTGGLQVSVAPHLVEAGSIASSVQKGGCFCVVRGEALGETVYMRHDDGQALYPSAATAVVNDIVRLSQGLLVKSGTNAEKGRGPFPNPFNIAPSFGQAAASGHHAPVLDSNCDAPAFYVRISSTASASATTRAVGTEAEKAQVSIASLSHQGGRGFGNTTTIITTGPASIEQMTHFAAALAKCEWCQGSPTFLPYMD